MKTKKNVRIVASARIHAELKKFCADKGMKLQYVANQAVLEYLEKNGHWENEK